jgi:hypothetical protein
VLESACECFVDSVYVVAWRPTAVVAVDMLIVSVVFGEGLPHHTGEDCACFTFLSSRVVVICVCFICCPKCKI